MAALPGVVCQGLHVHGIKFALVLSRGSFSAFRSSASAEVVVPFLGALV